MKTKKFFALLLALAMMLSLCSCWEEEKSVDFWEEDLTTTEGTPPIEEKNSLDAFTLPYLSNQSLDPITCADGVQQTIGALLYEGLFELDRTFTAQKVLCCDYSYDTEKFTYKFLLRSGVTFSDGSSLTLKDVLETYQRAAKSERYGSRFANVTSMRIKDSSLLISLSKGNSAFPALLDIPIVKSGSENDNVPLGTGPYLFVTENGEACLLQNSDWWQSLSLPLERIELDGIRDNETAAYLFASHEINLLVSDLTATAQTAFSGDSCENDSAGTTLLYLGFNTQRKPFTDAAVRSALSACINRDQISTVLLAGHAQSATLPISPNSPLYPNASVNGEFSAYESALSNASFNAEKPHTMTILVNKENSFKVSIAEHLCRQLSCEALTLSVKETAWTDYITALQNGNFDLYLGEVKLTADWDISKLISGTLNYGSFYDEKTNELLSAFLKEENESTAEAFCKQFTAMTPFAPLAFKTTSVLTANGLADGLSPTIANPFYQFSNWQFHFDP